MRVDVATLVDLVVVITLLEAAVLVQVHRQTGRGVAPRDFLLNLVSGLCLMLALRCHVRDAGLAPIAAWLMAAGLAHLADLALRWRAPSSDEVST